MTLQNIKAKVEQIANEKGITEQEIYNRVLSILENSYNYVLSSDDEANIVSEIKNKMLKKLYRAPKQRISVNQATKYDELFGLDKVEHPLANKAWDELSQDGLVSQVMYEISLTEPGTLAARNL